MNEIMAKIGVSIMMVMLYFIVFWVFPAAGNPPKKDLKSYLINVGADHFIISAVVFGVWGFCYLWELR